MDKASQSLVDRPRDGAAQDDPADHLLRWRRGVSELHGQRVRPPRVDRFPARGEQLLVSLRPAAMVAGRQSDAALPADLQEFDRAMLELDEQYQPAGRTRSSSSSRCTRTRSCWSTAAGRWCSRSTFTRPSRYTDLRIPVPDPKDYRLVLDTDATAVRRVRAGGAGVTYPKQDVPMYGRGSRACRFICRAAARRCWRRCRPRGRTDGRVTRATTVAAGRGSCAGV